MSGLTRLRTGSLVGMVAGMVLGGLYTARAGRPEVVPAPISGDAPVAAHPLARATPLGRSVTLTRTRTPAAAWAPHGPAPALRQELLDMRRAPGDGTRAQVAWRASAGVAARPMGHGGHPRLALGAPSAR